MAHAHYAVHGQSTPSIACLVGAGVLALLPFRAVIGDLLAKAQALGETELQADPGFQSALRQTTTRFGLTLGLDSVDKTLDALTENPATAKAVPRLRR